MKGHIRKRGDRSWAVIIELGRDPETGKRRQKWHTVKGTKRDAEKELARLVNALNTGRYVAPSKLTLADYLQQWLTDYAGPNTAPRTRQGYEINIRRHIVPCLGRTELAKLKPVQIQGLYTRLLAGGLSPKTIRYVHTTLHGALKRAVQWDLLPRNPAEAVEPPKLVRHELTVLDPAGVQSLLAGLDGHRLRLPVLLAVTTGLRRGELLGLTWSQVDLAAGVAHITQSLGGTQAGMPIYSTTKTPRSRRAIALPGLAVQALHHQRRQQEEYRKFLGSQYRDYGLVICLEDGRAWDLSNFEHTFRRKMDNLGFAGIRFHDLRHTHATLMLQAGVHPKIVSERLGHSQIAITMDTYSHVMPQMQREAAGQIDRLLGPGEISPPKG